MVKDVFSDLFCSIVELLEALGVTQIERWTELWSHEFDGWKVFLNGTDQVVELIVEADRQPFRVEPGHVLVAWQGAPVMYCTPFAEPDDAGFHRWRAQFAAALDDEIARVQAFRGA